MSFLCCPITQSRIQWHQQVLWTEEKTPCFNLFNVERESWLGLSELNLFEVNMATAQNWYQYPIPGDLLRIKQKNIYFHIVVSFLSFWYALYANRGFRYPWIAYANQCVRTFIYWLGFIHRTQYNIHMFINHRQCANFLFWHKHMDRSDCRKKSSCGKEGAAVVIATIRGTFLVEHGYRLESICTAFLKHYIRY